MMSSMFSALMLFWDAISEALPVPVYFIRQLSHSTTPCDRGFRFSFRS
jgi:hypothetical protein